MYTYIYIYIHIARERNASAASVCWGARQQPFGGLRRFQDPQFWRVTGPTLPSNKSRGNNLTFDERSVVQRVGWSSAARALQGYLADVKHPPPL